MLSSFQTLMYSNIMSIHVLCPFPSPLQKTHDSLPKPDGL